MENRVGNLRGGLLDVESIFTTLDRAGISTSLTFMSSTSEVLERLTKSFSTPVDSSEEDTWNLNHWPVWEAVGLYYCLNSRATEALAVFFTCYEGLLKSQKLLSTRFHKGKPLVLISDVYWDMGMEVHAKRHLMLALCEDAITDNGTIPFDRGAWFRGRWRHGMSDSTLQGLVDQIETTKKMLVGNILYPEALLQSINENWIAEYPSSREVGLYIANGHYIEYLQALIREPTGKALEQVAHYLISCVPGMRTRRRLQSRGAEYDILCSINGAEQDFRSEFGRYFVCECKDWGVPADLSALSKFLSVLLGLKARFGILFSVHGVTGKNNGTYAAREQIKIYQSSGCVIIVVDSEDIKRVADGENFIELLRRKYEAVRGDLYDY